MLQKGPCVLVNLRYKSRNLTISDLDAFGSKKWWSFLTGTTCFFFLLQLWVTWSAQAWSLWGRRARPVWMSVSPVRWGGLWSSPMLRISRTERSSMSERWSSFLRGETTVGHIANKILNKAPSLWLNICRIIKVICFFYFLVLYKHNYIILLSLIIMGLKAIEPGWAIFAPK